MSRYSFQWLFLLFQFTFFSSREFTYQFIHTQKKGLLRILNEVLLNLYIKFEEIIFLMIWVFQFAFRSYFKFSLHCNFLYDKTLAMIVLHPFNKIIPKYFVLLMLIGNVIFNKLPNCSLLLPRKKIIIYLLYISVTLLKNIYKL